MKITNDELRAFRRHCGWLLVPCGITDDTKKQRFRARLMFRQDEEYDMTPDECAALGRLFADWPRRVAAGDAGLPLLVQAPGDGHAMVRDPGAALAAGYRAYLRGRGGHEREQRERASGVWRAAFPDPGTPKEIYGPIPTRLEGLKVERTKNEKYLTEVHGGIDALTLAKSLAEPGPGSGLVAHKTFNFARPPTDLVETAQALAKRIDEFASKLSVPDDRRAGTTTRVKTTSDSWFDRVREDDNRFRDDAASKSLRDVVNERDAQSLDDGDNLLREIVSTSSETDDTAKDMEKLLTQRPVTRSLKLADEVKKLGQHGWLMRHLGLVVEIEVDMKALDADEPHDLAREFLPGVVAIDAATGLPRDSESAEMPLKQGVLELAQDGQDRYRLTQFDQQGGLNKFMIGLKAHLSKLSAGVGGDERTFEFAPHRTAVLTLLDKGPQAIKTSASRPQARNAIDTLYAHQIMIGMRVDVQRHQSALPTRPANGTAPWRSLMGWRVLDARINNDDITDWFARVSPGEGMLARAQRVVPEKDTGRAVVTEPVFSWDGWSLAVPLPDPGGAGYGAATSELEVGRLKVRLVAAGGLPALRVGSEYRVGVRAVFADGFGPELGDVVKARRYETELSPTKKCSSASLGHSCGEFFPFKRYEPIAPPDVHVGERPDYDKFPQQSGNKVVLASSSHSSRVHRQEVRWIVPPPVSLEMAVMLGAYDRKGMLDHPPQSAFEGICLTPSGRFPNISNPVAGVDGRGHRHDNSDTIYRRSHFARRPVIPYLPDPWARRVVLAAHRRSDGRAVAFAFHDYYEGRGAAGWPDCRALRLEVLRAEDSRAPSARTVFDRDSSDRSTIRLRVAAGDDLDVHLWHEIRVDQLEQSATLDAMVDFLDSKDGLEVARALKLVGHAENNPGWLPLWNRLIERLAHWQEMRDHPLRSQTAGLLADGLTNLTSFGMFNPSQVLRVVHAVDKPAAPRLLWSGLPSHKLAPNAEDRSVRVLPAIKLTAREETFRFVREPGHSDALLAGDMEIERSTTARVDIRIAWSDTDDTPGAASPQVHAKTALVSIDQLPPALSVPQTSLAPNSNPAPAVAEDEQLVLLNGVRTMLGRSRNEDVPSGELRADLGDSRARKVDISITAQSRFASEFRGTPADFISPPGVLRHVVVPSSAVPPRPDVDYVMPQYLWLETGSGHSAHERVGGCFRIWLNRPWFASGFGEKLAIVCWPDGAFGRESLRRRATSALARMCGIPNDPPDFLERFITRWGLDPLWGVTGRDACIGSIPAEAFRKHWCDGIGDLQNARASACFPIVDLRRMVSMKDHLASYRSESVKVALVLYEPKYDAASRRHYVDVQIDERYTYFPFVRLSLARYQEHALPGYELSELSVQEFVQLPPARRTTAAASPHSCLKGHLEVSVSLTGPQPEAPLNSVHRRGTRVTAHLEYLPAQRWQALAPAVEGDAGLHGVAWVPELHTQMILERDGDVWKQKPDDLARAYAIREDRIYSVVVQEFELGRGDPPERGTPGSGSSRRLLFSDRLLLSVAP